MYISAIPFILTLRSSNIYSERSLGVDRDKTDSGSLQVHLQNQLAYDLWWIILAVFLIAIIERTPLATPAPGFSLFSIIFEVVSAYGTVGLSLGLPYADTSFCGAWKKLSKLILISVMLRGRHRILPLAVDRAVLVPGHELMERLDEDMLLKRETRGNVWKKYEAEIRREEEGEQAESGGGQDEEEGK